MQIQTLSVVVGTPACDAHCPFCVSKMTPNEGVGKTPNIRWRRFKTAIQLAKMSGVTTVMLTGKGEPTLWPDLVSRYIEDLAGEFPFVELQTNGLGFQSRISDEQLTHWGAYGLTTVVISVAHYENARNHEIYMSGRAKEYPDLTTTIDFLHDHGFSVRLNCVLLKGYVSDQDGCASVYNIIDFAQKTGTEQLTLMPVNAPFASANPEIAAWVKKHRVGVENIKLALEANGTMLMDLAHGARIYDVAGQNVCLSNCLSQETYTDKSVMRNLIFFPDGHLRYDWAHTGAILL